MKKIILIISILIAGIGLMCYAYFSKLINENNGGELAIRVASKDASLIFSYKNDKSFYQILEGQELIQRILGPNKTEILKQFKEKIINNEQVNNLIKDQEVYLSILPDENQETNFIFTTETKIDKTLEQLQTALKQKGFPFEKIDGVYKVNFNDSSYIYLNLKNKIITATTSLFLAKKSISESKKTSFEDYIKANNKNRKNVLATLFINFNTTNTLLKNILTGSLTGGLSFLNKQNSYAALNYNFSKERILFNGVTEMNNNDNYLKIFESTPAQSLSIANILPDNTANYTLYAFDSYSNWTKKLQYWFELTQQDQKSKAVIRNIKNQFRIDLDKIFPEYSKNQFITFQLSTGEKLAAVLLSNGEKVKQLLLDLSSDYSEDIKNFKSADILLSYYGLPFKNFSKPYYTIIDNHLIVANTASTLQVFLSKYKNNKLLIQTANYLDAIDQISSTANLSFYIDFKNSNGIFKNQVTSGYFKYFNTEKGLKYFDSFIYQMSAEKDKFTTNLLMNKYAPLQALDSVGLNR